MFSRRFFFTGAALSFCVMSAYAFAQFPYDNLCDPLEPMAGFSGIYTNVETGNGEPLLDYAGRPVQELFVEQDTNSVFCEQSWR